MASSPDKPKKEDPATIATSVSETARKRQELRTSRRGGFYSDFRNIKPTAPVGGGQQTVG